MANGLNKKRVAVIGLDGIAWHVLKRLFKINSMPYLCSIVKNSLKGILKSTLPPFTPPAWTSIATGVNPGKHGVFDFLVFLNNYAVKLASSHDIHYPRIHEMVALKGLKTICVNQPLTYPIVKSKNMIVISDWIAPKLCYYPNSLSAYVSSYKPNTPVQKFCKHPKTAVNECLGRISVINQLAKKFDWNLFWVVYSEPDHILHGYYRKIMKEENYLLRVFTEIDKTIEIVSRKADMVVIVSDHGFSEYKYTININSILYKLRLLIPTQRKTTKHLNDFLVDHTTNVEGVKLPAEIHRFLLGQPLLKSIVKKIYKKLTGKELTAKKPDVDISRSKAFLLSGSSHGIYVKEQSLINLIINKLEKTKSINKVYRREEVFHGPYVNRAPHILIEPDFDKGFTIAGTAKISPEPISAGNVCNHHPDGIIIASGDRVPAIWLKQPVQTVDIAPTILHYLGLPLPTDTDGKPLPQIHYLQKEIKYHNYLQHWKLIRQIQIKKSKLKI